MCSLAADPTSFSNCFERHHLNRLIVADSHPPTKYSKPSQSQSWRERERDLFGNLTELGAIHSMVMAMAGCCVRGCFNGLSPLCTAHVMSASSSSSTAIPSIASPKDQSSSTALRAFDWRRECGNKKYINVDDSRNLFSLVPTMVAFGACTLVGFSAPNLEAVRAEEGVVTEIGAVFQRTCAGCHAGGGNIVQPNATLFAQDLERNGLANVDEIFQITYSGKGRMPGYGEKCTPRGQCTFGPRLSDSDIHALAEFVRLQANQRWPK